MVASGHGYTVRLFVVPVADVLMLRISLIRMAIDLNLHRKTAVISQDTEEGKARDLEVHNRERTWLLCYCLDRSLSSQMGKPHSIKEEYVASIDRVHWLTLC
jgi:Fungal specific transcription factor domain